MAVLLLHALIFIPEIVGLNLLLHGSAFPAKAFNLKSVDSLETAASLRSLELAATLLNNEHSENFENGNSKRREKQFQKTANFGAMYVNKGTPELT